MTLRLSPELVTLDKIELPAFRQARITAFALRLDKIHPVVSGNKYYKLKYHLLQARQDNYRGIVTFGGPWSNHIVAAAYAASAHQLKSIGIIRGERPAIFSPTLQQARESGMQLEFISRTEYANARRVGFNNTGQKDYPGYYMIPEGGSGAPGIKGAGEILDPINKKEFSHIMIAMGSGTTFFGIAAAAGSEQQITGIPVLKGMNNPEVQLAPLLNNPGGTPPNCSIFYDYHFGGFAKYTSSLIAFMNNFYRGTGIPSDFVYTGKLFYAACDLAEKKFFPPDSRILVLHSGGLQGNRSLNPGMLIF